MCSLGYNNTDYGRIMEISALYYISKVIVVGNVVLTMPDYY